MDETTDGLIVAYAFHGDGDAQPLDWDEVDGWSPSGGFLWVHMDRTAPRTLAYLRERSGLHEIAADAILAEETRPRIALFGQGVLLILRGVNCNPGSEPEDMVSLRLWVEEERLISLRQRRVMAVQDVRDAFAEGRGPESIGDFVATVIEKLSDRIGEVCTEIDDRVDQMEDDLLSRESSELRIELSSVRRRIISLRRYIAPQRDLLIRVIGERFPWLTERIRLRIQEAADRTTRFVEDLDSARDRATIMQEELNNRLTEQMNRTMYVLSLVAAIFLPLGLLTGLLGINVGGIPGADNKTAFLFVCLLLVGVAFFEYWLFRRKRWL